MLDETDLRALIGWMNNSELDFKNFIHNTLMFIKDKTHVTAITLMLYDNQLKRLKMAETIAEDGQQQIARYEQALQQDDNDRPMGITDWVYRENTPVCVANVHTDALWSPLYIETDPSIVSELDLPLRNGNAAIGVLCLESDTEGYFTDDNIAQLMPICDTFALKIETVRAYQKQEQLKDGFLQIANISHVLFDESRDLQSILEEIMETAMRLTNTNMGNILLYHDIDDVMYIHVCRGATVPDGYYQRVSEDDGVVGRCAALRQIINVPDVRHPLGNYREIIPNMCSELAVPIINRYKLLGVVNLESDKFSNFDETDEQLMSVFAEQIGMALQHREQEKRLELSRLRESTIERLQNFVNASNHLKSVLKLIVENAKTLTDSDYCSIHLFENDVMKRVLDSDGVDNNPDRERLPGKSSSGKGLVGYMVEQVQHNPYGERLYNTGKAQEDVYYVGSHEMNSNLIYVAIREHDGEIACLLNVESKKPFAYGSEEAQALRRLGDFAVLAINRARDVNRLRLLNRASEELIKINMIDHIDEAYQIIINIADENIAGIQTIIRRKEGRYNLVPVSVRPSLNKPTIPPRTMRVDEYPNDEVIATRQVVSIPDTQQVDVVLSNPRFRAVMIAPLIWDNDLYGTITFAKERPRSLDEGDAQLLSGLAGLLAQTIHRLNDAQVRQSLDVFNKIAPSWGTQAHSIKNKVVIAHDKLEILIENEHHISQLQSKSKKILETLALARAMSIELCRTFETWDYHPPKQVDIRDVWRICVNGLQAELESARLQIHQQYSDPRANFIYANEDKIKWVFENLLENAIHILPATGGSQIQLRTYVGGSELDPAGTYVYIVVEDDGPGVEPELIKKIFNPKVSSPLYNKEGVNTGMGLFFSRLFVEEAGGQIWVENKNDGGAMFIMRFPLLNYQS